MCYFIIRFGISFLLYGKCLTYSLCNHIIYIFLILNFIVQVPYLGSDFSAGLLKGYPSTGRFSSFTNQKGLFPLNGEANYRSNGRILNVNDRFKSRDKFNRNEDFESSTELTRGPRSRNKSPPSDSAVEKEVLGFTVSRDKYNLPDFQTDYESAKFYVIKSYSEDDVHKSIKYDVWASTPNGNKKLDAAFRDAEAKSSETGKRCPIFLFFSVIIHIGVDVYSLVCYLVYKMNCLF